MSDGRFVSFISDEDLYLFNEGTHRSLGDKLGAHPLGADGGAYFAVWAPNATSVSVVGDFNGWQDGRTALFPRGSSGIWEGSDPDARPGHIYKYAITSRDGQRLLKADPYASCSERPPRTGSVVWDLSYEWHDEQWMGQRGERQNLAAPISIYEVHLGSFCRPPQGGGEMLSYTEVAESLIAHVAESGFTHVELMPVMEHPFYGSWGYQVTSYFAPSRRYGNPQDLMSLIDALHQAGIGVIFDWVPSHFPGDEFALANFDGTHLYEHADPRLGVHPDWDSCLFNYGRHEVRSFLLSSAHHWLRRYHGDGLRVDGVASMLYLDYSRQPGQWIPNRYGGRENLDAVELLKQLNTSVYADFPDVQTYAEESTAWPGVSKPVHLGGLGFGFKWDMGWMHDTLSYFSRDPIYRSHHQGEITFRGLYAFSENYVLPLSHDEVTHGKRALLYNMPGDEWQRFANLRLLFSYQYTQPGKKLLFMGDEFAAETEWNHEAGLDWSLLERPHSAGVLALVRDLNRLYRSEAALHELDCDPAGFSWANAGDAAASTLAYLRRAASGETVLVACNFTPVPRHGHVLGVPFGGHWRELFNSDAEVYGGSGQGNFGGVHAEQKEACGFPYSLSLTLPPLGCVVLKGEATGGDPS